MGSGHIQQGSREAAFRNVSIIRGVIAGEVAADAGLVPGEASLRLGGCEIAGSVIEIESGEVVFSTPRLAEVAELLGGESTAS